MQFYFSYLRAAGAYILLGVGRLKLYHHSSMKPESLPNLTIALPKYFPYRTFSENQDFEKVLSECQYCCIEINRWAMFGDVGPVSILFHCSETVFVKPTLFFRTFYSTGESSLFFHSIWRRAFMLKI